MLRFILLLLLVSLPAWAENSILDLSGSWRFSMDRNDAGISAHWERKTLEDRITLPGILQSQGYGDQITTDTP